MKEKIVLLHGALGSKKQLEPIKDILNQKFECYSFNFHGHGGDPIPEKFRIPSFGQQLINYLEQNFKLPVHVFGYSMGGYVALKAAAQNSELFKSIITLATKFDWSSEFMDSEEKKMNPELIELKVPKFAQYLDSLHHPNDWKVIMLKTIDMMRTIVDSERLTKEELLTLNVETHIALGTKDKMVSEFESKQVVDLITESRFHSLEGVVHPIERNDPLIISDFVSSLILK